MPCLLRKGNGVRSFILIYLQYYDLVYPRHVLTDIKKDKLKRDKKIIDALVAYGYMQVEIASYLGMHYSTINLLKGKR